MTNRAAKIKALFYLSLRARILFPQKMETLKEPRRYKFMYGGRGGAKSETVARYLLWLANRKKMRVLCTREIQNSINDSVYCLLCDLITSCEYEAYDTTQNQIRNMVTGSKFIFAGLQRQERRQTIKSYANIDICWVEEAQSISKESLDILIPTIRKQNSEIWFTYNRLFPQDPVHEFAMRQPDDRKTIININYYDNPFLPETLLLEAELSKRLYEQGISDDYLHIWLGEPVGDSDHNVFSVRDIQAAAERQPDTTGQEEIGVDVARYGNDRTTIYKRKGLAIVDYKVYNKLSTVDVAKEVIRMCGNNIKMPLKIDDTGVGGGVTDYLKEIGFNAIGINFGGKAKNSDMYNNVISEAWFEVKNMIGKITIPDDAELKSELMTREWKLDNRGRRCIESKDDYKKRGYRSPDKADGFLLAFYNPEAGAHFYFEGM